MKTKYTLDDLNYLPRGNRRGHIHWTRSYYNIPYIRRQRSTLRERICGAWNVLSGGALPLEWK